MIIVATERQEEMHKCHKREGRSFLQFLVERVGLTQEMITRQILDKLSHSVYVAGKMSEFFADCKTEGFYLRIPAGYDRKRFEQWMQDYYKPAKIEYWPEDMRPMSHKDEFWILRHIVGGEDVWIMMDIEGDCVDFLALYDR